MMLELSTKRVNQILYEETQKTEPLPMVLRAIYTRYMHVFEKYLDDIDALNEDTIAELRQYHEETKSLVKYYYLDIPKDICVDIEEFEEKNMAKTLGPGWCEHLFDAFEEFVEDNEDEEKSRDALKAEFSKLNRKAFYAEMESIFREGFGTESKTGQRFLSEISGLLFEGQQ